MERLVSCPATYNVKYQVSFLTVHCPFEKQSIGLTYFLCCFCTVETPQTTTSQYGVVGKNLVIMLFLNAHEDSSHVQGEIILVIRV